jgi:hypothetical protein
MTLETFLVEHYRPGLDTTELWTAVAAIRQATATRRERHAVRYLRSTVVPADEAFISVFEADSEQSVRDAYASAGLSFDRISKALEDDGLSPDRKELQ